MALTQNAIKASMYEDEEDENGVKHPNSFLAGITEEVMRLRRNAWANKEHAKTGIPTDTLKK